MKEVQPSFRVEWYKSCTLSFKLREKRGENSPKWYIEEGVHISWLQDGAELINESRIFGLSFKYIKRKNPSHSFAFVFCIEQAVD